MNNQLPDKTVILSIIATIILIFSLIFAWRPNQNKLEPSIEWRDSPGQPNELLKL